MRTIQFLLWASILLISAGCSRSIAFEQLPVGSHHIQYAGNSEWRLVENQADNSSHEHPSIRKWPAEIKRFLEAGVNEHHRDWSYELTKTEQSILMTGRLLAGEPQVTEHVRMGYFRNGRQIDAAETTYFMRKDVTTHQFKPYIAIHDGNKLRVYDDRTGIVHAVMDLSAVFGRDDTYSLVSYHDDFVVVHAAKKDVLLLAANGQVVPLYKKLLSISCQLSIEHRPAATAGVPTGDGLTMLRYDAAKKEITFRVDPGPECDKLYKKGEELTYRLAPRLDPDRFRDDLRSVLNMTLRSLNAAAHPSEASPLPLQADGTRSGVQQSSGGIHGNPIEFRFFDYVDGDLNRAVLGMAAYAQERHSSLYFNFRRADPDAEWKLVSIDVN